MNSLAGSTELAMLTGLFFFVVAVWPKRFKIPLVLFILVGGFKMYLTVAAAQKKPHIVT